MPRITLKVSKEVLFNKYPITTKEIVTIKGSDCDCSHDSTIVNYCPNCGKQYTVKDTEINVLNNNSIYNWSDEIKDKFKHITFTINNDIEGFCDLVKGLRRLNTNLKNKCNVIIYWDEFNLAYFEIYTELSATNIVTINQEYYKFKQYFGDLGDIIIE